MGERRRWTQLWAVAVGGDRIRKFEDGDVGLFLGDSGPCLGSGDDANEALAAARGEAGG